MSRPAFLAALQLADSGLPIGRFAHSAGLEALLAAEPGLGEDELIEVAETYVLESVGPLDGVAVAAAHGLAAARELPPLLSLDALVTARKLTPASRLSSTACGRRLAGLAPVFGDREPVTELCSLARSGKTAGNLAVIHGALAQLCSLSCEEAVLVELRSAAAALLSAAVRLSRLSATRAQRALRGLIPTLEEAAGAALRTKPESMRSAALELELYSLVHARAETRLFTT